MNLQVASAVMTLMRASAVHHAPREACGILLGRTAAKQTRIDDLREVINIHTQPDRFFEIDPAALIEAHKAARAGGAEVVGYFHSHPNGNPDLSDKDREMAAGDGKIWAVVAHIDDLNAHIKNEVRFFEDRPDGFAGLEHTVIETPRDVHTELVEAGMRAQREGMSELATEIKRFLTRRFVWVVDVWANPNQLHGVWLTVFLRKDGDIPKREPMRKEIIVVATKWLANRRSVPEHAIEVVLKFDSKEAVDRDYGGSWFARAR